MKKSSGGKAAGKMWIYCTDSAIYSVAFVNADIAKKTALTDKQAAAMIP